MTPAPTPPVNPNTALADLTSYINWSQQVIPVLSAAIDSLTENKAKLEAELQTANAEIDRLETALEECQNKPDPEPEPEPTKKYLGASLAEQDGVIADARRVFNSGNLPANSANDSGHREAVQRTANGGYVWTSWKMEGGRLPSAASLRTALKSFSDQLRAKGQKGLVTFEHEPDIKDTIPVALYHSGYDLQDEIIEEFDNLQSIVVCTGFKGDKGDFSAWEDYYRPNHKWFGADHYNKGMQQAGEPLATPAENWGNLVKFAKSKNQPLCIGESGAGTDSTPGRTIRTRPDWYKAHRAYALDPVNNIVVVTMFNARQTIMTEADVKAWYGLP